jgi:hypothetical protein
MAKTREKILAASAIAGIGCCALAVSPRPRTAETLSRMLAALIDYGPQIAGKIQVFVAFAAGAGIILVIFLYILELLDRRRRPGGLARRRRRSLVGALFMLLALLVAYRLRSDRPGATTDAGPPPKSVPTDSGDRPPTASEPRGQKAEAGSEKGLVALAALAGACVAGAAVVALLLKGVRDGSKTKSDLAEALGKARRRLLLGDSMRDAIVACYADMCDLFTEVAASIPGRGKSLTAREFAESLRTRGSSESEIAALTEIFEKARYSNETCGEEDRATALSALLELEKRYSGGTP